MHGPAHWAWGYCPVRWLNRHALVALPERVEESNAKPVSEQLLSILNSDVLVLILDMTERLAGVGRRPEARGVTSARARRGAPPAAPGAAGWAAGPTISAAPGPLSSVTWPGGCGRTGSASSRCRSGPG